LLKFPESISKRGRLFPQIRLRTPMVKDTVYRAIAERSATSQWKPLAWHITKITRYEKKSSLKAFAKVDFGDGLEIECRVLTGPRGLWVAWPARKQDDTWVDQVMFIDTALKHAVESAVIAHYCQ
jgi:DNA-binding cell septation regulator SpoVG